MNASTTSTSASGATLAPIIAFDPRPLAFEQAPYGESAPALAEVIAFDFAGSGNSAA